MTFKKVISSVLAVTLAVGSFAVLPQYTGFDTVITASAKTTSDGFVIEKNESGMNCLTEYKGKGGNITIPKDVTVINDKVFCDNTSIKSVTFAGDAWVGKKAFSGCCNLEKVEFKGDSVRIEASAFSQCTILQEVKINKKATTYHIGQSAFYCNYNLKTVTLSDDTQSIGYGAFVKCPNLTSLTIPENTKIDPLAIGYCYGHFSAIDYYASLLGQKTDGPFYAKYGDNDVCYNGCLFTEKNKSKIGAKSSDDTFVMDENKSIYMYAANYQGKATTLKVVKGSPAEEYAKDYKIKYTTYKPTATTASTTTTVSNKTDSSDKLAAPTGFNNKLGYTFMESCRWCRGLQSLQVQRDYQKVQKIQECKIR